MLEVTVIGTCSRNGETTALARAVLLCLLMLILLPCTARPQARLTATDLTGRVADPSGGVLPDATVTIVNVDTNVTRTLQTNARGQFHAPALSPGTYRVVVERAGFAVQILENIPLLLGQSQELEIVLNLAGTTEDVTVASASGEAIRGQTAISSVVGSKQIESLPINGRNFISFSVITPGVTTDRTPLQGALMTSGLSFGGQRARSNNVMVDGLDNNDITTGSVRATFSQEAIREFQVLTNSYSAEFGKASGGVVNIVTKSGTNAPRGGAFGYFRDETLNAKDYFEKFDRFGNPVVREKAPFGQLQWGGVLGGPIKQDKTFLFLSFERREVEASTFVTIDPSAAELLATVGFPVELGNVPYEIRATDLLGKIDHQFSPLSTLAVRGNLSRHLHENIEPFGGIIARSRGAMQILKDWSVSASHTHVASSGWVNEARVQFARQDADVLSLDPKCGGRCDGALQGGPTLELPGVASVGRQRFTPQRRKNDRYQVMETLSLFRGGHAVKAGVELNHMKNPHVELPLHFGGRFIFAPLPANAVPGLPEPVSALQALALGLPAAYVQGYGNPITAFDYNDVSLFLQDDWKIGERITLKPGVRYQKQFWPPLRIDVSNVAGKRFEYSWPQDGNNVAPRLAVAVAIDPTGPTSIHAAYGHYYDHHIIATLATSQIVNGSSGVRTLALRFPASIAAWNAADRRLPEPPTGFPSVEFAIDPRLATPYARHIAAGVDRALGPGLSFSGNFVSVSGKHQLGSIDYNPIVPSLGPGRRPNDIDGRPGTSASVLQYTSFGETWYKGLTLSLSKPLRHRYEFLAAYTLSDAEDTSTDFQSAFLPEDNGLGRHPADREGLPIGFDPSRERGPSSQDQRHRFVLSGVYQLPFEMQLSGVVTAASGRPFTPLAGADLNGDGDGGAFPPDRARRNPLDPGSSVRRHSETLPKQIIVDARFTKRCRLRDRVVVDAVIEAFNLFDRVNFSEVNNIFGRGSFPGAST
jgi:hypothetical protein